MMEEYKFKKSTCERYDIKFGGFGWAIFTIDENGGLFNCHSDYGDYNYSWPNHGRKSFKHFIIELARDSSYFIGKVSRKTHFNFEKCLNQWKNKIIEMRKENECTKDDARQVWDFIEDVDSGMSHELVFNEFYNSRIITDFCGDEFWHVFEADKEYPPSAVCFAKEVMPIFADILKKELDESIIEDGTTK